jgi:hypothetical protein
MRFIFMHFLFLKSYLTSPVLVYFSLSERFFIWPFPKNAMYDEFNASCLDEVVPRQIEFKWGGEIKLSL